MIISRIIIIVIMITTSGNKDLNHVTRVYKKDVVPAELKSFAE